MNDNEEVKRLTKELKKKARKIKLEKNLSELKDNNWDPVKMHKKGYTPKHTKLKDLDGNQVHDRLRAETFAEYYEKQHWAETNEIRPDIEQNNIFAINNEINTGEITLTELSEAIKRLKNNKAPGPDDVPAELIKWLDDESRQIILEHLNRCWRNERLPKDMNDARLAIIFKKGSTDLPENYRPIALQRFIQTFGIHNAKKNQ